MGRVTSRYRVVRLSAGGATTRPDTVVTEEPLEIRVGGRPLAITMRTPGNDFDLARGFLVSEGVVAAAEEISAIRYCAGATSDGVNTFNIVDVTLAAGVAPPDPELARNFYTTSSCGLCGKASLDAVRAQLRWPIIDDRLRLSPAQVGALPDRLRAAQKTFDRTGGLHAAGLFTAQGEMLCAREDVGRHNAVDKVIGWMLERSVLPGTGTVLMVSGRASFELVQKAVLAGIPVLAAVSAPSSLAVDLAAEAGLTLIGFVRGTSMNIYTHGQRIDNAATIL